MICQGNDTVSPRTIKDYALDIDPQFTYLGSTTSDNATLDAELGKKNWKGCSNNDKAFFSSIGKQETHQEATKIADYRACIVSTLLYGNECWTTYAGQGKRLHTVHMRYLRRILSISYKDKVTNSAAFKYKQIFPRSSVSCPPNGRRPNPQGHLAWESRTWVVASWQT